VYCLSNAVNKEIYVGISNDVERRLAEHNKGRNRYTKAFIPWKVIFKEPHPDYMAARVREKYFKSAAGKKHLHKILNAGSLPAWRSQAGIPAETALMPAGTVYVYCLSNAVNKEIYVGISNDVERRLLEHNKGRNRYTKAFVPWKVIFIEPHPDYMAARVREKYFKSAAGKKHLHKILNAGSLPA
jgi:predicted GIY-YIG superfamily endonuclease